MALELETDRLRLRLFRESDLDAYSSFCADPEVMQFIGAGVAVKRPDAWRQMAFFVGQFGLRGYGMWALELKASGELLGRVGFLDPPEWPGFEIGWLLGRPYWGQGYALEAARVALRYALDALRRDRVISLIRPDNRRSIRLAEALGERLGAETQLSGSRALIYEVSRGS